VRVGIASDHGGFDLKDDLMAHMRAAGYETFDFGAWTLDPNDDYPDFVIPLGEAVVARRIERGVAICGSGVGDNFSARQGVEDDHMNVICVGGRTVGPSVAWDLVRTFLEAEFTREARHLRRIAKVASLEQQQGERNECPASS